MAKVRVYELAKELGVESKVVLAKLQDMGEFVRSASSTVEAPVVRKLKEVFPAQPAAADGASREEDRGEEDHQEGGAKKTAAADESAPQRAVAELQPQTAASAAPAARCGPEVPAAPAAPEHRSHQLPPRRQQPRLRGETPEAPARPAGPRPGNNPFTSERRRSPRPAAPRPGNNPFTSKDAGAMPRPVPAPAVPAGPGGSRPHPGMMPAGRPAPGARPGGAAGGPGAGRARRPGRSPRCTRGGGQAVAVPVVAPVVLAVARRSSGGGPGGPGGGGGYGGRPGGGGRAGGGRGQTAGAFGRGGGKTARPQVAQAAPPRARQPRGADDRWRAGCRAATARAFACRVGHR